MLLAALATGCKNYLKYTVTTRIWPNGSIERVMLVEGGDSTLLEGDYSSVLKGSLPVPGDSTWKISVGFETKAIHDTTTDTIYYYKAVKTFRNDEALNKELNGDTMGKNQVIRHVEVEKRFRGYSTLYRYAETYKQIFPFTGVPVSDYLTNEELELYHAGDNELYYSPKTGKLLIKNDTLAGIILSKADSVRMKSIKDSIEKKYENWMCESIFKDYYNVLKTALDKSGTLKPAETDKSHDSLRKAFYYLIEADSLWSGDSNDFPLLRLASRFYEVDTGILHKANQTSIDDFHMKLYQGLLLEIGESFTNHTIMPGIITSTNASEIKGNTVSWNIESDDFFERDFTMVVESRKVNRGMAIVTGAFVLLLLVGLVAVFLKKK